MMTASLRLSAVLLVLAVTPTIPTPAVAAEGETSARQTPYYQGRMRLALNGGLLSSGNDSRFFIAASFGVFVIDNLEAGLDTQFQFGENAPFIAQLGPALRYIYPVTEELHPYLGAFYRHWFIGDDIDDIDTLGVRGGIMIQTGRVFFQLGIVYEAIVSQCDAPADCDDFYPEFGISLLL